MSREGSHQLLRVLIDENEQGTTCLEYDKPFSLFGQLGNAYTWKEPQINSDEHGWIA